MGWVEHGLAVALVALALDVALGWPARLHARIGHPVVWIGGLIGWCERCLNHGDIRVFKGLMTVLIVVSMAALPLIFLIGVLRGLPFSWLIEGVLCWPLVAARSLHDHVAAVARPLIAGDLAGARAAVAMIVGRDVSRADEAAVSRAALESLAENTSDGVVAPLFWAVFGGLPGIAAYKAINTMDSMIGHRNARYEQFGRVAARLDDGVNLPASRLTAALFALAGGWRAAWRAVWADAHRHRSPNAGWPEAAMAGALGVRLSGPRAYGDRVADEPWLNGAARDPLAADLARGLAVYRRAIWALAGGLAISLAAFTVF